jgi:hypothetical protein
MDSFLVFLIQIVDPITIVVIVPESVSNVPTLGVDLEVSYFRQNWTLHSLVLFQKKKIEIFRKICFEKFENNILIIF